jgi:RNA polymerase primary sigma factor
MIADEKAVSPYDKLDSKMVQRTLRELVGNLNDREVDILRARFGLDGGPRQNLEQVGQRLGITRERVRQIQNIALGKLRRMLKRQESGPLAPLPASESALECVAD